MYLIIVSGAPGSGKTTRLVKNVTKLLNIKEKDCVKALVDNLVTKNGSYKKKIDTLLSECDLNSNNENSSVLKCSITENSLYERFKKSYFDTRKVEGCGKLHDGNGKKSCDDIIWDLIIDTLKEKKKHVILEMVGSQLSRLQYFLTKSVGNSGFIPEDCNVVLAYSLVNLSALKYRNKLEFKRSLKKYVTKTSENAPRLVNVRGDDYIKTVEDVKKTLKQIYKSCIFDEVNTELCGTKEIDRLLIYDNNFIIDLLYDSQTDPKLTDKDFDILINRGATVKNPKRYTMKLKK